MELKNISIFLLVALCQVVYTLRIEDDVEEIDFAHFLEEDYKGDFTEITDSDKEDDESSRLIVPMPQTLLNITYAVLYGASRIEPGTRFIIPGDMYYFSNIYHPHFVSDSGRTIWNLKKCKHCLLSYKVACNVYLRQSDECQYTHLDFFYTKDQMKGERYCRERRFVKKFVRDSRFVFRASGYDPRAGFGCVVFTESSDIDTATCDECGPSASPGFYALSQYDTRHCKPHCYNGGSCAVGSDELFECTCPSGTTGRYCEVNYDDCDPNPCHFVDEGSRCIDLVNDYKCECPFPLDPSDDCASDMQTLGTSTLYYSNETETWSDAEADCASMSGHLAYADNIQELMVLADQVRDIYDMTSSYIWIGGYFDTDWEAYWSSDDSLITSLTPSIDRTSGGYDGDCLAIYDDGYVYSVDCSTSYYYMCRL